MFPTVFVVFLTPCFDSRTGYVYSGGHDTNEAPDR